MNQDHRDTLAAVVELFVGCGVEATEERLAIYCRALAEIPPDVLRSAVVSLLSTWTGPPAVPLAAHVHARAREIVGIQAGRMVGGFPQPGGSWSRFKADRLLELEGGSTRRLAVAAGEDAGSLDEMPQERGPRFGGAVGLADAVRSIVAGLKRSGPGA